MPRSPDTSDVEAMVATVAVAVSANDMVAAVVMAVVAAAAADGTAAAVAAVTESVEVVVADNTAAVVAVVGRNDTAAATAIVGDDPCLSSTRPGGPKLACSRNYGWRPDMNVTRVTTMATTTNGPPLSVSFSLKNE